MKMKLSTWTALLVIVILISACDKTYYPKPKGYFRVDYPKKQYETDSTDCGFTFERPVYARTAPYSGSMNGKCWFNVYFPRQNATVHLTYRPISGDLDLLLKDAFALVHKHDAKANSLNKTVISNTDHKTYGLMYDMGGEVATPYQFFMHDSTSHFLRGALYFSNIPNADSLAPSLAFIREDVEQFISTFEW